MKVGGAGKRMRAVDGKQEINLEWPNGAHPSKHQGKRLLIINSSTNHMHSPFAHARWC